MIRFMRNIALVLLLAWLAPAQAALDIKDIAIGAKEQDVKRQLPSVHCKPLQWESKAADRRCDDSRVTLGGVEVQVTFYLKKDSVEAFDVRFNTRELDRLVSFLKTRYGKPETETREAIDRKGDKPREVYKALWQNGKQRAVLIAQLEKRRASMLVSRGDFDEEIYRVR
jgi:hypothetical protein